MPEQFSQIFTREKIRGMFRGFINSIKYFQRNQMAWKFFIFLQSSWILGLFTREYEILLKKIKLLFIHYLSYEFLRKLLREIFSDN